MKLVEFENQVGASASAAPPAAPAAASPSPAPSAPAASSAPSASAAPAAASAPAASAGGRVFASPAAKKEAKDRSIDLAAVPGSGPNGRVLLADVASAKATPASVASSTAPAVAAPAPAGSSYEDIPVTSIRRVTAARLTEAKRNIPHYYLTVDTTVDELLKVRAQLNASGDVKLSVNDFVIKVSGMLKPLFVCLFHFSFRFSGCR